MLKNIAIVVAVLLAALLAYAATKPDSFRVERATSIKAPPEKIFALINDLHSWDSWSPYEKKDPAMKRTFSGPTIGTGAVYEWDGNSNVGKGRMEILATSAPSRVTIKLDFEKPLEGHDIAEFTLQSTGGSTNVTWAMYGPNPYIAKLMSIFFNMDTMVGADFEAGLANLKAVTER